MTSESYEWRTVFNEEWSKLTQATCGWSPSYTQAAFIDCSELSRRFFVTALKDQTVCAYNTELNPIRRAAIAACDEAQSFFISGVPVTRTRALSGLRTCLQDILSTLLPAYELLAQSLLRLRLDLPADAAFQSEVLRINTLGDPHDTGSCVRSITFQGGRNLIFKPRSAANELALNTILRQSGIAGHNFPSPLVSAATSSWWEPESRIPLHTLSSDDALPLGMSLGYLLGLAVTFGYEDLHYENVVFDASGLNAVVVDSETAFAACLPTQASALAGLHELNWMAHRTGLIPCPRMLGEQLFEESPLISLMVRSAPAEQKPRLPASHGFVFRSQLRNLNASWFASLGSSIERGIRKYLDECSSLLANPELIARLASNISTRLVYRPTRDYYDLANGYVRDALADRLAARASLWEKLYEVSRTTALDETAHKHICEYEIECLVKGQIPLLILDASGMYVKAGDRAIALNRSHQLRKASHIQYLQDQRGWEEIISSIKATLFRYGAYFPSSAGPTTCRGKVPQAASRSWAVNLVNRWQKDLSAGSFTAQDGQLHCVDYVPSGIGEQITLRVSGLGLYRGTAGIALGIWSASRNLHMQLGEMIVQCFQRLIRDSKNNQLHLLVADVGWSMGEGLFGIAYAATIIGDSVVNRRNLLAQLESCVTSRFIDSLPRESDFISGTAGCLACYISICKINGVKPREEILLLLIRKLESQIAMAETDLDCEEGSKGGLAHGLEGIQFALALAYREMVGRIVPKEDAVSRLLMTVETGSATTPAHGHEIWCNGYLGVRRALLRLTGERYREIGSGLDNERSVHQLCCGAFGRVMYNLEGLGGLNANCDLAAHGEEWLATATGPAFRSYDFVDVPIGAWGFFQGTAGVLYYACGLLCRRAELAVEMVDGVGFVP